MTSNFNWYDVERSVCMDLREIEINPSISRTFDTGSFKCKSIGTSRFGFYSGIADTYI